MFFLSEVSIYKVASDAFCAYTTSIISLNSSYEKARYKRESKTDFKRNCYIKRHLTLLGLPEPNPLL